MKLLNLTWLFCALFALNAAAQKASNFFQPVPESAALMAARSATLPVQEPVKYQTWRLDFDAMRSALVSAPWEFTPAARQSVCKVAVPLAGGATEDFALWQIALMEPELAAKYPDIHTYAGRSLQNTGKTIRLTVTPRGFQAMILRPDFGAEYVQPYSFDQTEYYVAFDRADVPADTRRLTTGVVAGAEVPPMISEQPYAPEMVNDRGPLLETVKLKVYRYSVSATHAFCEDHGGTLASVMAAIVSYNNEISGVFERDIAMRLKLVANNDKLIFLTAATDPFLGTEVSGFAGQNSGITNTILGETQYDVGHVYCRYQGGAAAGVGGVSVCNGKQKGVGSSSGNGNGVYEPRFRVVVGQEIGHQLSGGHTWNRCNGGGGRQGNTAFEPGSGSTIMSYAGICGTDNVTNNADLYYHAGSIEEIRNYILYANGNVCGSYIETGNTAPVVTLSYKDGFYIPISTPFELDGSAVDADGDKMNYSWEEMDAGPEVPLGEPSGDAAIFRTYLADSVTYRYFPKLTKIINGINQNDFTEQLPTYTRNLKFRLTARDNRPNGGGVGWADVAFRASGDAGPFRVTNPNASSVSWRIGEYVNVQWDVANTDKGFVNCQKVNIRLSTDGGKTYPITLASGVPNNGSQYVLVPNKVNITSRIRIDAVDNVFFDISNANFRILNPTQPSMTLAVSNNAAKLCQPENFSTQVLTAGVLGFSTPVALSIQKGTLPAVAGVSIDKTTLNPGETANVSVDMSQVNQTGTYTFNVKAVVEGTTDTLLRPVTLTYYTNDFAALALQSPVDGITGQGLTQTVRWNLVPDADSYDLQISTTPSFAAGTIIASKSDLTVDSFKIPVMLEKGKAYYWHVRPKNECGAHTWTEANFFSTFVENCSAFSANDLPKNLSSSGTPTIESVITVNAGGAIQSMNVKQVKGFHAFFKDLDVRLISPAGTEIVLFKNRCGNYNGNFNVKFDDIAQAAFSCPPSNTGTSYRPESPLSPLVGQTSAGPWRLRVKDTELSSGGTIDGFQIEFCAAATINPPFLVNNNTLKIVTGTNAIITPDLLRVDDANNTHAQLIFTLVSVPKNGELRLNGNILEPGAQFSQYDVDLERLRFYDYGARSALDGFRFVATDNEGGFVATPKFNIQPEGVDTDEPGQGALDFGLFPNPATESVWVAFDQPATSDAWIRMFNMAGQLVQSAQLPQGSSRLQLPLAQLPQGVYAVQVESATATGVKKLVVNK